jgi:hypothetical protein
MITAASSLTPDDTPPPETLVLSLTARAIRGQVSQVQDWDRNRRRLRRAGALFLGVVVLGGPALLAGWWR